MHVFNGREMITEVPRPASPPATVNVGASGYFCSFKNFSLHYFVQVLLNRLAVSGQGRTLLGLQNPWENNIGRPQRQRVRINFPPL